MPFEPLRIAYLADARSIHTRRWLQFFVDRGHDIHLLARVGDALHADLDPRIIVHGYEPFGRGRWPLVSSLQGRRALSRLLDVVQPAIVHAHYLTRYGWQARLSGFHPYVVTLWGSDLFVTPRGSRRARIWGRAALRGADLVTVMSDHMADAAIALGAHREVIRQIQFGVDTARFRPGPSSEALRSRLQLEGRRVAFSPRAIAPLYRPDVVVRALKQLPDDVVVVASERNADRNTLLAIRSLADDLGIADRIRFISDIAESELPEMYRLASVVVSVPDTDGLPVSVLEAMASGVPVVASDIPGLRSALGTSIGDFLTPVGDAHALAQSMARALDLSDAERGRIGRSLRASAVGRFDYQGNMQQMETLYAEMQRSVTHSPS